MEDGETFTVALLCVLQRTCLPRKSTEIRVDMPFEAHTATGFGINSDPRRQQMALIRESG
jgi:hypothetical protein